MPVHKIPVGNAFSVETLVLSICLGVLASRFKRI